MSQDPESKSLINRFLSDPVPKGWLGQRGHITQPGATPQVKRHTSLDHRAIIHQKHKTVSDGCTPALINARFLLTVFGELPLDVRHV